MPRKFSNLTYKLMKKSVISEYKLVEKEIQHFALTSARIRAWRDD